MSDTERLNWLIENIDYFPMGWNGCPINRFDFFLATDISDLRQAIDVEIEKENKLKK
jgi:hypothetical protein